MIDAAKSEPMPQGDGAVVLPFVLESLEHFESCVICSGNSSSILACRDVRQALKDRAEMGRAKYGTYLRINNGRDVGVDYFQELLDAVMYSGQAKMMNLPEGAYFEATLNLTIQVARTISERK